MIIEPYREPESIKHLERHLSLFVSFLNKRARMVYLGEVAIQLGVSLERVEYLCDILVERGVVRLARSEELTAHGFRYDAIACVLVSKPSQAAITERYW